MLPWEQPSTRLAAGRWNTPQGVSYNCVPKAPRRVKHHLPTALSCLIFHTIGFLPYSLPYSLTGVVCYHFPNKLALESLSLGRLLGKSRPRHWPPPLGLQELLSNYSLRSCTPKGQGSQGPCQTWPCPVRTKAKTHHLTAKFCTSPFLSSRSLSSIFTTLRSLSSSSWMESFCSSDIRSLVAMNLGPRAEEDY